MVLLQNSPSFLFWGGNLGQENVFYDILERKNTFLGYKKDDGFGPKLAIFPSFFLGTLGQENVFYDILERKNTFLGYKNKNFEKSMVLVLNLATFPFFF